jgi:hypothetical protein
MILRVLRQSLSFLTARNSPSTHRRRWLDAQQKPANFDRAALPFEISNFAIFSVLSVSSCSTFLARPAHPSNQAFPFLFEFKVRCSMFNVQCSMFPLMLG